MASKQKQQSAIEYLMTYGWAILIIVVVLAILFLFNIFNGGIVSANTCLSSTNFACISAPILNSSGYLSVNLGNYGSEVVATGIACTNSSAPAPASFFPLPNIDMQNGLNYTISILCPIPSGIIGTKFNGALWLQYKSVGVSGLVEKITSISVAVSTQNPVSKVSTTSSTSTTTSTSTTSTSIPSTSTTSTSTTSVATTTVYYAMVGISNNQNVITPAPFQVLIDVPSSSYSSYINPNWNNVKFTTSADGAGTALEAWVEENATNTAGSTPVWITLPYGISANGGISISMNFMPTNVMNATCAAGANPETNPSTCDTGEAPNLSATYAQYDNGVQVFNFYDDFAGTALNSHWSVNGGWSYTVNNGLTITQWPGGGGGIYSTTTYAYPMVVDSFADPVITNGVGGVADGAGTSAYSGAGSSQSIGFSNAPSPEAGYGSTNAYGSNYTTSLALYTIEVPSSSIVNYFVGYGKQQTMTSAIPPSPLPVSLVMGYGCCGGSPSPQSYVYWIRERAYPPNGVMPVISFGGVV